MKKYNNNAVLPVHIKMISDLILANPPDLKPKWNVTQTSYECLL